MKKERLKNMAVSPGPAAGHLQQEDSDLLFTAFQRGGTDGQSMSNDCSVSWDCAWRSQPS